MTGPLGLHGGGEYLPGDERFLDALLDAADARRMRMGRAAGTGRVPAADLLDVRGHTLSSPDPVESGDASVEAAPIRIVIVPTAAARGRPDAAADAGRTAFAKRVSARGHRDVDIEVARIVDRGSASDRELVARLLTADLIHFPGGDPDLIPAIFAGTPAREALEAVWRAGAVLAGASAGAMALAEWTWTPHGGIRGLGFVRGLAVVPHYDDVRRTRWQAALDNLAPGGIGYLGLDERTGVVSEPDGATGRRWRVAGEGAAHWFARGSATARTVRHGDVIELPA